jgi:hypothetical protein
MLDAVYGRRPRMCRFRCWEGRVPCTSRRGVDVCYEERSRCWLSARRGWTVRQVDAAARGTPCEDHFRDVIPHTQLVPLASRCISKIPHPTTVWVDPAVVSHVVPLPGVENASHCPRLDMLPARRSTILKDRLSRQSTSGNACVLRSPMGRLAKVDP